MADFPMRPLGATGETVSAIGIGGWHLSIPSVSEDLAIRITRTALDRGINFLDNSWDYNDGESERRMGKALQDGYRDRAFLMTKIDGRSRKEATRQLEESLRRLKVETVDLVQHHEVIRFEDPNRIFDEDGAQAGLEDARKAGKLRYIGFTGHKDPRVHLYMLEVARENGIRLDTCQMPLNVMDAHFRSFEKLVLPALLIDRIGVLGMKSMGNGILLRSKTATPVECLRYALNLPTSVVIAGIDSMEFLDQACKTASMPVLTQEERIAILDKTAKAAARGVWEPFKTSSIFDSTATNPEWLGEEPEKLRNLMP